VTPSISGGGETKGNLAFLVVYGSRSVWENELVGILLGEGVGKIQWASLLVRVWE
jgi:hypothetical protein